MTKELFLENSYLKEFRAGVEKISGREVILDRTAFYPGGGGQPPDKGKLGIGPVGASVVDARREGASIVHVLDRAIPHTVGELRGTLDWDRRHAFMRHRTALHVLYGVLWKEFGAKASGGRMRAGRARVDLFFSGEWTASVVGRIERLANAVVAEKRPVKVYELPRAEALANPDLTRTQINPAPENAKTIRVVEVEGLDTRADGGTHVANTGEIGELSITSHKSKGGGEKRVDFVLR